MHSKYFVIYIHIFSFLLISPSSLLASYKDFFASYKIGELINIQNPKKIPHIKKLRDVYKEKKRYIRYSLSLI
jgi:hypothetical protein